jgi:type IV secretory pathway TraG/TraD family ATPase VirD4
MFSGFRKYGKRLILTYQNLSQIDDTKVLNSVLSNPYVRICFRVGDTDSAKLESSFSFFDRTDLQSLSIGHALVRIGSATNDGNIQTYPLSKKQENYKVIHDLIVT